MANRPRDRLRAVRSFAVLARSILFSRPVRRWSLAERLAALPTDGLPVQRPVAIRWNKHQVPWIEASTDRDCAVALGVAHAHLRLGQMEMMRRIAQGRTAEMLGPVAIEADHLFRSLNVSQAVPAIMAMLPEATREWLDGFVDGVNHVVAQLRELPPEFDMLALQPEPWTASDVITLGRAASADVTWLVWFRLWHLHRAPEWSRLWDQVLTHQLGVAGHLAGRSSDDILRAPLGAIRGGSNAWAVAARASMTGGALLACDPHLAITVPNLWMLAAYRCPSFHVTGLMLPGLPFVAVGRNPWIAWGGTAAHAASSDLFDLSALPGEGLKTRTEIIEVRGGSSETVTIRTSRYGPIISDAVHLDGTYALRWIGHEPSDELSAMLGINRARSFDEFQAAVEGLAVPGQTFIVAEATGGIGKQIAVKIPCRPGVPQGYPIVEPANIQHWQRFATASDFAPERNPECGFLVSANDRPAETPVPLGFLFSPADRRERIAEILAASRPVSPRVMREVQRDVTLAGARPVRDHLVALIEALPKMDRMGSARARVLALLRNWDGSYSENSRGALAFELLTAHLCRRCYSKTERVFHAVLWTGRALVGSELAAAGTELCAALKHALKKTSKDLDRYQAWGDIHRLVLAHPLASLPLIGRRFAFADLPTGGSSDTVMKTAGPHIARRHNVVYGSVARFVTDLAGMDETYAVLLGGQDGWLGSDTMLDQLELWRGGEAIRLPLQRETVLHEFPHTTWLRPRDDR